MLSREEALSLVKENVKTPNLIKHMLAVEAIMRRCAEYLGDDADKWGLLGLVHDIDFESTKDVPDKHGILSEKILFGKVSEEILRAVKSHNSEHTDVMPESNMENCLIAADAVSGLIIASALIVPSKRLVDVKVESLIKKFKEKDFARNCSRENILYCEKIGIKMNEFLKISLEALKEIAIDLEL